MSIERVLLDDKSQSFDFGEYAMLEENKYPLFGISPSAQQHYVRALRGEPLTKRDITALDKNINRDRGMNNLYNLTDGNTRVLGQSLRLKPLSPFFPVYTKDNTFLGVCRITTRGLVAIPAYSKHHVFTYLESSNYVLKDYKIYVDADEPAFKGALQGELASNRVIQKYTIDPAMKSLIAIPACLDVETYGGYKGTTRVSIVFLYNLRNSKVLELCLFDKAELNQFISVLPAIANVSCSSNIAYIRVTDDKFTLEEATGTVEERHLWTMSHPELMSDNKLIIDEKSSAYRLICPPFRVSSINISAQTGTDKLAIYDLPGYNTVVIYTTECVNRQLYFADSCSGTIALANSGSTFQVKSEGNLHELSLRCKGLELQCTNSNKLSLISISDAKIAVNNVKQAGISDTELTNSIITNVGVLVLDSTRPSAGKYLRNTRISNVNKLLLQHTSAKDVKLSDISSLECSAADLHGVEMRNMHLIKLENTIMKNCTLYAINSTDIGLDTFSYVSGNLKVATPTGNITLSTSRVLDMDNTFNSIYYLLPALLNELRFSNTNEPLNMIISSSTREVNVRYVSYFDAYSLKSMLEWFDDEHRINMILGILLLRAVKFTVPKSTTLNLELAIAPMPSAISARELVPAEALAENVQFSTSTFTIGVANIASELNKELSVSDFRYKSEFASALKPALKTVEGLLAQERIDKITIFVPRLK